MPQCAEWQYNATEGLSREEGGEGGVGELVVEVVEVVEVVL